MKLASHDSMTYLKPKKWYLYPFRFMSRCQSKTIKEQYEDYGIRYFDLRIKFNGVNPEFTHGIMTYKCDVNEVLRYLNSHNEEVQIRLLLETTKANKSQESKFRAFCQFCEEEYKNLKFHNGRRKFDWQVVYEFKNPEPSLDQKVSSMTGTILDDWYPEMYAKKMNHINIQKGTDKDYLMLDFLHIQ